MLYSVAKGTMTPNNVSLTDSGRPRPGGRGRALPATDICRKFDRELALSGWERSIA
jgi:hypothetical protein